MSATRILSQAVPCLLNSFPSWRQPTHVRLYADGAGAAVPVAVAAKTTPGLTLERDGVGQYTLKFPACRDVSDINVQIYGVTPETAGTRLHAVVDANAAETLATLGQFQFYVSGGDDGANQDLASGDILDATFWLDLG